MVGVKSPDRARSRPHLRHPERARSRPHLRHPERARSRFPCVILSERVARVEGSRFSGAGKTPIARRRVKSFTSRLRVDNASPYSHRAPTYPHVTVRLNLHPPAAAKRHSSGIMHHLCHPGRTRSRFPCVILSEAMVCNTIAKSKDPAFSEAGKTPMMRRQGKGIRLTVPCG